VLVGAIKREEPVEDDRRRLAPEQLTPGSNAEVPGVAESSISVAIVTRTVHLHPSVLPGTVQAAHGEVPVWVNRHQKPLETSSNAN
jgi:hypothetical protein